MIRRHSDLQIYLYKFTPPLKKAVEQGFYLCNKNICLGAQLAQEFIVAQRSYYSIALLLRTVSHHAVIIIIVLFAGFERGIVNVISNKGNIINYIAVQIN